MDQNILISIGSFIFGFGVIYGVLNTRIKTLESQFQEHRDTIERLARVEEKLNLLIQHFIK
jgi:hypothetical protein